MQWLLSNLDPMLIELKNMIQKWQWQHHVQRRVIGAAIVVGLFY